MQSLLLNRQRFNDYLSKATPGDEAKHIEQILQSLENTIAQGKRQPATVHVTTDKSITDSSYNHINNVITIPYHPGAHGIYYYSNLKHEDRHADQTYGPRDSVEKTLLEISRAIYPPNERIAKHNGDPSSEYLYNYGELDARCAEIQAFNDAFESRIKATPPDCNIIEKDEMLKVMKDTWSTLHLQQSQFELYLTRLQNIQSVLRNDLDADIMPCGIPRAVLFLATTAPALYKEKFHELQDAIKDFRTNMQALERWTAPEFRQQTQEAETRKMQEYREQEHQKVLQLVKDSGAHYDEFPPSNVETEVTQLASDKLLQWYLAAHKDEANSLYIVHIDVGGDATEHTYIAHRVLPPSTPPIPPMDKGAVEPEIAEEMETNESETILIDLSEDELDVDVL